jgi:hypothetical protein
VPNWRWWRRPGTPWRLTPGPTRPSRASGPTASVANWPGAKASIEDLAGRPCPFVAYPYGQLLAADATTLVTAVAYAGVLTVHTIGILTLALGLFALAGLYRIRAVFEHR